MVIVLGGVVEFVRGVFVFGLFRVGVVVGEFCLGDVIFSLMFKEMCRN